MKSEALKKLCQEHPSAFLIIPKPRGFRWGERIRLSGRHGPLGRVMRVNETERGLDVVACFHSSEVLDFLRAAAPDHRP